MSSLRKRSTPKAKGFKTADHWPSTDEIDGYLWNLSEPTGPSAEDAAWAADVLNQGEAGHATDDPPDEYYDALAAESEFMDRIERGLMP